MISQLLRKWFGLEQIHCESCDVLRTQLERSEFERRELLTRLLDSGKPVIEPTSTEEHKPITPPFTPWRVRQQMLEVEDRKSAQLVRDRNKEIEELENEMGLKDAIQK